ncbi:MAG: pimeloyl-ACP methyl ester carboxylesterase [Paracoccaceae bacterium]|jgi:pimeloyl-ACP methyl ester carboxylesterase
MATFTLLHGAYHGGWCWHAVASILRARGHAVTTPTQTGLGERRHLLSPAITLSTFADDLIEHLRAEDLTDTVLVGHSFGGCAIAKAAEVAHTRIARLVFLDAIVLHGDETPFDCFAPEVTAARTEQALAHDGGLSIPPPPPAAFGVTDPAMAAAIAPRLTPHPLRTYQTSLALQGPTGAGLPLCYVRCTDPSYPALDWALARAQAADWRIETLATGHDCMVTAPEATADLLEAEAARPRV